MDSLLSAEASRLMAKSRLTRQRKLKLHRPDHTDNICDVVASIAGIRDKKKNKGISRWSLDGP